MTTCVHQKFLRRCNRQTDAQMGFATSHNDYITSHVTKILIQLFWGSQNILHHHFTHLRRYGNFFLNISYIYISSKEFQFHFLGDPVSLLIVVGVAPVLCFSCVKHECMYHSPDLTMWLFLSVSWWSVCIHHRQYNYYSYK